MPNIITNFSINLSKHKRKELEHVMVLAFNGKDEFSIERS